ncbi:MAG: c-type cytochrome [bacterium]|nr:c-type cytochrome [bacterium]
MTVRSDQGIINLAEMEITSGGENVTARAELSQSSEYNGGQFPIANLVDGDRKNFSHTSTEKNPWIEARFDTPVEIERIKIWNRPDFERRFHPVEVVFFDGARELAKLDVSLEEQVTGLLADSWLRAPFRTAEAHLNERTNEEEVVIVVPEHLADDAREQYVLGAEVYARDGHCGTCHQPDGLGLQAAGFPPLAGTKWATGDEDRLVKLTLNGLLGPMEVLGKPYPGLVPMTPFGEMLSDEELAAVLTYVRNSFGNEASVITPEKIAQVRVASQSKVGFYSPEELEGGAATQGRAFVKMWAMDDFDGAFEKPLSGRSFANGRAMFEAATCQSCHNIQGEGRNVGADLSQLEYSTTDLLRHVLEPSLAIKDEHRLFRIDLDDESRYFGLIVERDAKTLRVAEKLQEPDDTVVIEVDEVVEIVPLKTSPMPTGLLAVLTREEILDLLAYVESNGDAGHRAFVK